MRASAFPAALDWSVQRRIHQPILFARRLNRPSGFSTASNVYWGEAGWVSVYLAHELALDRDVAIKVLPPERAGSRDMRERFRREARTAARLSHPNIVPLYTFGEVAGLVYFVMGYVAGESLAARFASTRPRGRRRSARPAGSHL
jgi:hypothetical protein